MKKTLYLCFGLALLGATVFAQKIEIPGGGYAVRAPSGTPTNAQVPSYDAASGKMIWSTGSGGGSAPTGTVVNTAASAAGQIAIFSDTTKTNIQPSSAVTNLTLVTPTLGAATATTINGTAIPSSATLLSSASGEINAFTSKATPTTSDLLPIEDAAASNAKKKITIGSLPFLPTGSIDYSLMRTNPGVTITNGNVQIWMKGSDVTGYADGATATGFTATTGGVFTNSASTCKYAATAVNGLPALYLQGAHPLLTQVSSGMGSAVNSSITMFAVVKIPDNPGGISLYASASGTPFYAGINGMGLLLNTANTSDSSISTGYKPTPGTNGVSTFVVFFRYDGTNKWLGDGLAWDVEPCTGSMGLNDPLVLGDVFGGGFVLNGWLAELIVYKSALPPDQCVGISRQLHYNYGIPLGGFEYLWCDGDSMTHGYGLNSFTNAWPNLLARKYGNNAFVFNSGVDGDTLTNIYSTRVGTIYRPPGIPSRAIIMAGRNDFVADSAPSAKVYELSWKLGRDLRKDGGFRVYFVSQTPTTGGSGTYDADRARVNAWMRAGWRQFSDGFVDMSRYSIFDTASTTTAWQGDQVHPSVSGEELIAYEVDRTIFGDSGTSDALPNAILTGTATYDPPSLTVLSTADTTVTVTGAIVGDVAYASHDKAIAAGWRLEAVVTSNDTVNVRFVNGTGGTLDLASGKLTVKVMH